MYSSGRGEKVSIPWSFVGVVSVNKLGRPGQRLPKAVRDCAFLRVRRVIRPANSQGPKGGVHGQGGHLHGREPAESRMRQRAEQARAGATPKEPQGKCEAY